MVLRLSGGRRLLSPPGDTARPTASRVRLAVMNCLAAELPGARWLDLCSGSGVMACEALQRGASAVVAIERDRRVASICRSNLQAVQQGLPVDRRSSTQVVVHCGPVERWLRASGESAFDLIYADPPYDSGLYGSMAEGILKANLLKAEGTLLLECGTGRRPTLPEGWQCRAEKKYGSTTLLLLQITEGLAGISSQDSSFTDRTETPTQSESSKT